MRKFLPILLSLVISIASSLNAQTISYGPDFGMSLSRFTGPNNLPQDLKIGLKAGMNLNMPLGKRSFATAGIFMHQKGTVEFEQNLTTSYRNYYTLGYIEIPVNFSYRFMVPKFGSIIAGFGPFVSYGVVGNFKSYLEDIDGTSYVDKSYPIKWGYGRSDTNPLDLGVMGTVLFELKSGMYLKFAYHRGFMSVYNLNTTQKYNESFNAGVGFNYWTWTR